jgi:hypothetical protein
MGELEPGDATVDDGAGEAVRDIPGFGLPARGGRALNANLVLAVIKRNMVIMRSVDNGRYGIY